MVRLLGAGESGLSLIYRINCQNCNYCNYEKKRVAYFYLFKITNLGANSSNSTVLLIDQLKTP